MPAERYHSGWSFILEEPLEEPGCHATWPEAAESLKELMRSWADEDDAQALELVDWDLVTPEREQQYLSDEAPAMLATVQSILRDDPPREPEDYWVSVDDHLERRIGFWLLKVMCDDPVHLESKGE